jgi:hypothetical protein
MGFPLLPCRRHGRLLQVLRRLPVLLHRLLVLLLHRLLVLLPHPLPELQARPQRPGLVRQPWPARSPGQMLRSPRTAQRPVQRTNGYS